MLQTALISMPPGLLSQIQAGGKSWLDKAHEAIGNYFVADVCSVTRRVVYAWKLIRSKAGSFAGITFGKSSTCCRVLTAARCEYNQTGPETGQIASSVPVMFCDVTICRAQWLVAGAADDHHLNLSRTWTRHLESNMAPLICQSNVTLSCLTHTSLALMGKSGMGGGGKSGGI